MTSPSTGHPPFTKDLSTPKARAMWALVEEVAKGLPPWIDAKIEASAERTANEIIARCRVFYG